MASTRVVIMGTVEDKAAFVELGQRMVAHVQANDPGTTLYNWFISEDGHFVNEDEYASTEDFGAAQQAGLLDEWMGIVEITGVHVLGDIDEAAKDMLADFGPVHYSVKANL